MAQSQCHAWEWVKTEMLLQEQWGQARLRQPVEVIRVVVGTEQQQRLLMALRGTSPVPPAWRQGTGTPPTADVRDRIGSIGLVEATLAQPQQTGLQTHLGWTKGLE